MLAFGFRLLYLCNRKQKAILNVATEDEQTFA